MSGDRSNVRDDILDLVVSEGIAPVVHSRQHSASFNGQPQLKVVFDPRVVSVKVGGRNSQRGRLGPLSIQRFSMTTHTVLLVNRLADLGIA